MQGLERTAIRDLSLHFSKVGSHYIIHKTEKRNPEAGASLMVQWLRIHLPMQGTQVQALVWEDSTCRGATQPVCHNY